MVNNNEIEYFLPGPNQDNNRTANAEITKQLQRDFEDVLSGIGYYDGAFSMQVKPNTKPYQAPLGCVAFTLQNPFKEKLEWLQQQDIIKPLAVYETREWCESFVLISKSNGKVRLYLDLARLNQALIWPVHRGATLNDIFPKLNNIKYLT